jgi:hypothetical protein
MILPVFRLLTDSLEKTPFANRTRMRQARYRLNLARQYAASARSGWSLLFIWSFSFVWLNQTDQMNHINPRSSRFPRQSRPSRLSQTSAIAPEAFAQCREGCALGSVGVSSQVSGE